MNKQEALDSLECFRSNTAHILGENDAKVKTIETCMMLVREAEETPSAQQEQKWIPCSERLPEENGEYLVTREAKGMYKYVDIVKKTNTSGDIASDIIAWMPLPEPYKEVKDDNNRKS